jgi:aryl-alcohol dehydrogenase-like predicted oxidoreductase
MTSVAQHSTATRLALGTAQFGLSYGIANTRGQVILGEARSIVETAVASGFDTLDTASAYGESETCLGTVGVGALKVVTKLAELPGNVVDVSGWVQDQVAASLSRLRVSSIYGLLLHRPKQLTGPGGKALVKALRSLRESGAVQKIGISIYSPDELASLGSFHPDLVQAPFNLVDRRIHTTGWLARLKDSGVEIHTRSTFLQGLLLMPRESIPAKFAPWSALWERWHNWLAENQASPVAACLAYPLALPEHVDRVIVGADSVQQIGEIISAATQTLSALPNLECDDERLINPSRWNKL